MNTVVATFEEAAERLGIKVASVRQRVIRKKWRTFKGNDGKVRIEIPEDELPTPKKEAQPKEPINSDKEEIAALKATVSGLERTITTLERVIDAEKSAHEAQKARAEAAEFARDLLEKQKTKRWWQR